MCLGVFRVATDSKPGHAWLAAPCSRKPSGGVPQVQHEAAASDVSRGNQARKRHININFFFRLVPVFTGFVPGTTPVCPWDKPGEKQGQTQEFSLFYTVEARFHRVCPWDKPGLSQGQSRGRRAAQKVYVKKVYVPFSLARKQISWWTWKRGKGPHPHTFGLSYLVRDKPFSGREMGETKTEKSDHLRILLQKFAHFRSDFQL